MQTANALVVGIRATEHLTIMTSAVPVVAKDILITLGRRRPEADTPARVERFTTSASRVRQPRRVLMVLLPRTIHRQDVRQSIRQRGPLIVVQVAHMHGMVIITFSVLFAEI